MLFHISHISSYKELFSGRIKTKRQLKKRSQLHHPSSWGKYWKWTFSKQKGQIVHVCALLKLRKVVLTPGQHSFKKNFRKSITFFTGSLCAHFEDINTYWVVGPETEGRAPWMWQGLIPGAGFQNLVQSMVSEAGSQNLELISMI